MRKAIAFFIIMTLLLTLGCAAKPTPKPSVGAPAVPAPAAPAAEAAAAGSTAAAVTEVDADLGAIDDLDDEFLSAELDSLDTELDFEI
ncbi:hypothetical protein KY359_02770 [Candidatus Woesearchaeota archaeon]|nr:hypothetical protein [Candidatus Woesearchaeota archaeon]